MSNPKRVAVLMGGKSSEHDVSMNSGQMVASNLDVSLFEALPVAITREGRWQFPDGPALDIFDALPRLRDLRIDCVFLALHGAFGEDGRIQGMLDLLGIPYTGSGCIASATAMDKVRSKLVVRNLGIRVAQDLVFSAEDWRTGSQNIEAQVATEIGFPCVVKNPTQGSSLGMAIPQKTAELAKAVDLALAYGDTFMVEEFLHGTEVTCGILDVDPAAPPRALPVTEIRPVTSSYFDYAAKYTPGATAEITPAEISEPATARVQEAALRVHQAIGCKTWSRSDMILVKGEPVWIEINTTPGMTRTSLYPQAAAAAGIPYGRLLELFVSSAIAEQSPQKG